MESSRPKEKKTKQHNTPRNVDRREKNKQQLDRTRKEGPGQIDGISETDFEVPDKNHTLLVNNLLIENNITNHNYINLIMNTPEKFSYFIEQLKCLTYEQWKIVYNSWEESIQTREIR
ncbi:unnamed protein product [Schistosoma curassoni]|uniref:Uncharacterized protein n=1 Tax=Schistosoma curassoni TaxID=6186 RepID=A0A183L3B3_9TREM|nr:unnamed protein product [Schistosoma curassoni]